jgi:hypothetical protein
MFDLSTRCALMDDGNIEVTMPSRMFNASLFMILDRRTGTVIRSEVKEGTDEYRRMVSAGRQHVSKATKDQCS